MVKKISAFTGLLLAATSVFAQLEAPEYNLKAAFLINFIKYIEWDTVAEKNRDFVIGIIGKNQIMKPLSEISQVKYVNEKKIRIVQFDSPDAIDSCQILFIPVNVSYPLEKILVQAPARGTLVVSESPGYAARGTAINFIIVNNNLKFEANMTAINSAGLKASSQLLKLAIIVKQ